MEHYKVDFGCSRRVASLRITTIALGVSITDIRIDDRPLDLAVLPMVLPFGDTFIVLPAPIDGQHVGLYGWSLQFISAVERNHVPVPAPLQAGSGIAINGDSISLKLDTQSLPQRFVVDSYGLKTAEQNSYTMQFENYVSQIIGAETTDGRTWKLQDKSGTIALTEDLRPELAVERIKLPQENKVGQYFVQSNSQALGVFPVGNKLSFAVPVAAEYWDGASWIAWEENVNWKPLTDNKGDTSVIIAANKSRFRLTYQIDEYHMSNAVLLQILQPNVNIKFTVEESSDNSVWTTRIAERTIVSPDQVLIFFDNGNCSDQKFLRFTFDGMSTELNLASIYLLTWRPGNPGGVGLHRLMPLNWDSDGNLLPLAHVKLNNGKLSLRLNDNDYLAYDSSTDALRIAAQRAIEFYKTNGGLHLGEWASDKLTCKTNALIQGTQGYDSSGEEATLYLGDLNIALRAKYGTGFRLNVAGLTDAFGVDENNGDLRSKGEVRLESGKGITIGGDRVVGNRGASLTPALGMPVLTATIPGYGCKDESEFNALVEIINNLRIRVNELESRLDSSTGHGLITAR